MRKYIIGGNWKMQIPKVSDAVKIAEDIASQLEGIDTQNVEVFVAPTFNSLYAVGQKIKGTKLKLAAQNMFYEDKGAYTGEVPADSLLEAGCEYVILGHSERRHIFGEDNQLINKKVLKALEKGLKPVLCIGETARERVDGKTEEINKSQLEECLKGVSGDQMKNVTIAYEPVWAINNKALNPDTEIKPATPEQAEEVHNFIRSWLIDKYGSEVGNNILIQYGGSMKKENCEGLLNIGNINGGLIGSASLSAEKFMPIIETASRLSK
ncbi:MAG: triose-phosphate isomerase [Promethearchaeota archaeon]